MKGVDFDGTFALVARLSQFVCYWPFLTHSSSKFIKLVSKVLFKMGIYMKKCL